MISLQEHIEEQLNESVVLVTAATLVGSAILGVAIDAGVKKFKDWKQKSQIKKINKLIEPEVQEIQKIFAEMKKQDDGAKKVVSIENKIKRYVDNSQTNLYNTSATQDVQGPRYVQTQVDFITSLFPKEYDDRIENIVRSMFDKIEKSGIYAYNINFAQAFI